MDQNWCDNLPQKLSWAQSSGEPSLEWDRNAHTLNVVVTHNCPSHNHMSHTSDVLFLFFYKHHPYYGSNITYCNGFSFQLQHWSKGWEAWIISESNTTLRLKVIPYTSAYMELVLVLKQNHNPFGIYSLDHFHDTAAQQKRAEQSRQSNFSTQILGKPLFPSATHAGAAQSKTHVDAFQNVSTAAINAQDLRKNNFQQRPSVRKSPQSSGSAW